MEAAVGEQREVVMVMMGLLGVWTWGLLGLMMDGGWTTKDGLEGCVAGASLVLSIVKLRRDGGVHAATLRQCDE